MSRWTAWQRLSNALGLSDAALPLTLDAHSRALLLMMYTSAHQAHHTATFTASLLSCVVLPVVGIPMHQADHTAKRTAEAPFHRACLPCRNLSSNMLLAFQSYQARSWQHQLSQPYSHDTQETCVRHLARLRACVLQVMRQGCLLAMQQALAATEQYMQPGACTLAPVFRDFEHSAGQPAGSQPSDATGHGPCRELFRLAGQEMLSGRLMVLQSAAQPACAWQSKCMTSAHPPACKMCY